MPIGCSLNWSTCYNVCVVIPHFVCVCYLVDPASSHMLVSKIKPCMSKYKSGSRWNCEWLIKSVLVSLMVSYYMDNRSNIELIRAWNPDWCSRVPGIGCIYYPKPMRCLRALTGAWVAVMLVIHANFSDRMALCWRCFNDQLAFCHSNAIHHLSNSYQSHSQFQLIPDYL